MFRMLLCIASRFTFRIPSWKTFRARGSDGLGAWALLCLSLLYSPAVAIGQTACLGDETAEGTWLTVPAMAQGSFGHTLTLLPTGQVLAIGGFVGSPEDLLLDRVELFDPATRRWSTVGSLQVARTAHSATLLRDGRVLVVGGRDDDDLQVESAELYDPETHSSTLIPVLGRYGHTATLMLDGRVLIVGGERVDGGDDVLVSQVDLYDPALGWRAAVTTATERREHTATRLADGRIVLLGGMRAINPVTAVDICTPHPTDGCSWSSGTSFTDARALHGTTLLEDGRLLVVGGYDGGSDNTLASAELYDPDGDTWTSTGSMAESRGRHGVILLPNGEVWAGGGLQRTNGARTCEDMASAEIYSPTTGLWRRAKAMAVGRYTFGALLLPSGGVFMTGGKNEDILDLGSNGIYMPVPAPWQAAASLDTERRAQEGRLLPTTGELAVFAGRSAAGKTAEIETFDPQTGMWTVESNPLFQGRTGHTTALLQDGRVAVVGGSGTMSNVAVELFDPGDRSVVTAMPALSTTRIVPTATVLSSGELLVCGGWELGTVYSDTCDLLDFEAGTSDVIVMGTARYRHTATRLPSGEVLLVGGIDSEGSQNTAEMFDPFKREMRSVASTHHKRWRHGAALLPSGRVLVSGGGEEAVATAEIYAPDQDLWFEVPSMAEARTRHELWTLPSGEVVAISGESIEREAVATTEIYDPIANIWRAGPTLGTARYENTSDLLLDGRVAVAAGNAKVGAGGSVSSDALELWDPHALDSARRRPTVTSAPSTALPGDVITVMGTGFFGDFTAGGDNAGAAAVDGPVVFFRSLENAQLHPAPFTVSSVSVSSVSVSSVNGAAPTTATLEVTLPDSLDPGFHTLYVVSAGVPSPGHVLSSTCPPAQTRQPTFDGAVAVGSPATLSLDAPDARFLQWEEKVGEVWTEIPGAVGPTYETAPVLAADVGREYRVQVFTGCRTEISETLRLNLTDNTPPTVSDIAPSGGEYWLLGESHRASWTATDAVRLCRLQVDLVASPADASGGAGCPLFTAVDSLVDEDLGVGCGHPGVLTSSRLYPLLDVPAGAALGDRYRIRVTASNAAGLETVACSERSFNLIDDPGDYRTLILADPGRMASIFGLDGAAEQDLRLKIQELADHPRVDGLVLDLGAVGSIAALAAQRDLDDDMQDSANRVLFDPGGIHEYLLEQLELFEEVRYLMVVGDDRIIPMARLPDETLESVSEQVYVLGDAPDLGPETTVGKALSMNHFLSDDPLATLGDTDLGDLAGAAFAPDLAIGRLVETPDEIVTAIDTFLRLQGRLDLTGVASRQVLVTGYDFLDDVARRIEALWTDYLGSETLVDGDLIGRSTWDLPAGQTARQALRARLGAGPGIYALNGHANHYGEGVPSGDPFTIEGLETPEIYGTDAELCTTGPGIDLDGSVIYAVGCHGGLPVPGSCDSDADRPLDLPQSFLARGALAYVANSGYGWGLLSGVGYSEQLQAWMTEELLRPSVVVGDAVRLAKLRYFEETPRLSLDPYARKTLMQWTVFGFPMAEIRTDAGAQMRSTAGAEIPPAAALRSERRMLSTKANTPDFLTRIEQRFYFDAGQGVYRGFDSLGNPLVSDVQGALSCPSASDGCYFDLNGAVSGGTDLPLEPYFVHQSNQSGTSQHGVLWLGSRYKVEYPWRPVIGRLTSNIDVDFDAGATPRSYFIHPLAQFRGVGGNDDCRTQDVGTVNRTVVTTGEAERLSAAADPAIAEWQHRRAVQVDLEMLYYNRAGTACDRQGPSIQELSHTWQDRTLSWSVMVQDEVPEVEIPDPDDPKQTIPLQAGEVWRVLVVYTDHVLDENGEGRWLPIDLVLDESTGRWTGLIEVDPAAERLSYMVQAADDRGNVSWRELPTVEAPTSDVPRNLAQQTTLTLSTASQGCIEDGQIFCSGFEGGTADDWSAVSGIDP